MTKTTPFVPTLLMLMGLPASGKSTFAASLDPNQWAEVNKDAIREELTEEGWVWSRENEKDVIQRRDGAVVAALKLGMNVVSSDTNFGRKHKTRLEHLARTNGATFEIKVFDVPLDECLACDTSRLKSVGEKVIRDMWAKFVANDPGRFPLSANKLEIEPVRWVDGKPEVVICDLDGTLALNNGHRSFYDASKCDEDALSEPIYRLLRVLHSATVIDVIYCSGREDQFRSQTRTFLDRYNCPQGQLLMRPTGDHRKDWIVKLELFNQHIRGNYNVAYVLDDRDQVVRMWRQLGLTTLQVADGAF